MHLRRLHYDGSYGIIGQVINVSVDSDTMVQQLPRQLHDDQFPCRNCGGGDRGGVAIYRPFGNFAELKSHCHLYGAQGQRGRTSCPCHDEFRGPRSDYVRQEGTTDQRGRSHPPQCITSREDRQIVRMAVTDRSVTSRTVVQHIESVTHHSAFARTIRRRLQQSGLSATRPLLGLPLTQNHRRLLRQ
ncbi:transposable element Tcb1 transposase [Trichonephila clavipes]|nr:transposable element Tcb1 transposase [Trichonephila clavipes]